MPSPPRDEADVFDVLGEDPADDPSPAPIPAHAAPSAKPRAEKARPAAPQTGVAEVWSRGAEWGPDLLRVAVAAVVSMGIVWISMGNFGAAAVFFLVGVSACAWLSYPIVVTLERPVRVTPEQAAKDYYGALSHHMPHYRRMWLLLADAGRVSSSFGSFEGFKAHWKEKLGELRGSTIKPTTPIDFEVADFKSEKSAGLSYLVAKYRVNAYKRGEHAAGPIANFAVDTSFCKGPDGMWYLNKGTI